MSNENTAFSQHLAFLNRGELDDELTAELTELVKMVRLTGKKGQISITLKISMMNRRDEDTVKIEPSYKTALPQLEQMEAVMFSTADGDLLRNDPKQQSLDLKEVITSSNKLLNEAN